MFIGAEKNGNDNVENGDYMPMRSIFRKYFLNSRLEIENLLRAPFNIQYNNSLLQTQQ